MKIKTITSGNGLRPKPKLKSELKFKTKLKSRLRCHKLGKFGQFGITNKWKRVET